MVTRCWISFESRRASFVGLPIVNVPGWMNTRLVSAGAALWNSRRAVCSHPGEVRVVSGIFLLLNLSLRDFDCPRVRPLLEADMAIGETENTGPAVSAAR